MPGQKETLCLSNIPRPPISPDSCMRSEKVTRSNKTGFALRSSNTNGARIACLSVECDSTNAQITAAGIWGWSANKNKAAPVFFGNTPSPAFIEVLCPLS